MSPLKGAALFLGVLVGLFMLSVTVVATADRSVADLPVISQLPDLEFEERSGRTVTRDDLLGRVLVLDFFFTECPTACPAMSKRMGELYRAFEGSDDVRLVSVTVDPENDTPERLEEYARSLGVTDDRWWFLRGPIDEIVELSEKGLLLAASDLPLGHSTRLVLIDRNGQIRGYYDGLEEVSIKHIKTHVRGLVRK